MKVILVLLLLFLVTRSGYAQPDLRFGTNDISLEINPCDPSFTTTRIVVHNRSSDSQVFDLMLIDSASGSLTFYDRQTLTPLGFHVNSIHLPANDSLSFDLIASASSGSSNERAIISTTEGIPDILNIQLHYQHSAFEHSFKHDFEIVEINDSAVVEHSVTNSSEIPLVVRGIMKAEHWRVQNIAIGDTLKPGDTRTLRILFPPKSTPGDYSTVIAISGSCGLIALNLSAIVPAPGVHWAALEIRDTVYGCRSDSIYTLVLRNTAPGPIYLDSVGFEGEYGYDWMFIDPPVNQVIKRDDSLVLKLYRNSSAGTTIILAHEQNGDIERLMVRVFDKTAVPVIKNFQDTLVFNRDANKPVSYIATLENQGPVGYKVQSMEVAGSPLWQITMPDTTKLLGYKQNLEFEAQFAGTDVPGDYPITYTVRGTPCDTALSQTLIARVVASSVDEATTPKNIKVYPSIASGSIQIEASGPFSFSVIDVLGNVRRSGECVTGSEHLAIDSLPQGQYFVRIEIAGAVETHRIAVRR